MKAPLNPRLQSSIILILAMLFLFIQCDDDEPGVEEDFIRFDIQTSRHYSNSDSVNSICWPYVVTGAFNFYGYKTFTAIDDDFFSVTLSVGMYESSSCPTVALADDCEFTFILTRKNEAGDYIDFENRTPLALLTWTQENRQADFLLKGTFQGWLYQWYAKRPTGLVTEGTQLDSIYVKNGKFRLTVPKP